MPPEAVEEPNDADDPSDNNAASSEMATEAVVEDLFPVEVRFQLLVDAETDKIQVEIQGWSGIPKKLLSRTHPERFETVVDQLVSDFQTTTASYAQGRLTIGPDTGEWIVTTESDAYDTASPPTDWPSY